MCSKRHCWQRVCTKMAELNNESIASCACIAVHDARITSGTRACAQLKNVPVRFFQRGQSLGDIQTHLQEQANRLVTQYSRPSPQLPQVANSYRQTMNQHARMITACSTTHKPTIETRAVLDPSYTLSSNLSLIPRKPINRNTNDCHLSPLPLPPHLLNPFQRLHHLHPPSLSPSPTPPKRPRPAYPARPHAVPSGRRWKHLVERLSCRRK